MRFIPSWLIILAIIAIIVLVGNMVGIWHIHFTFGGSFAV